MLKNNHHTKTRKNNRNTVQNPFNRQPSISNSHSDNPTNDPISQPRANQQTLGNVSANSSNNVDTNNNNNQSQTGYIPDSSSANLVHVASGIKDSKREQWGDELRNKTNNTVRIAFRNIDHMPENRNSSKNAGIVKDIYDADLDIIGLSEVNLAWQNVSLYYSLSKRFSENFQHSKFISANNRTDSPIGTTHQVGGTILGCIGTTACRIIAVGKDERDLGRWSYITLRGNSGHKTHIVSIYRPVCSTGTTSAYQQQVASLAEILNIYECPRDLFFSDLRELLFPWQDSGDTIVVGGDFNEDIRSTTMINFFKELLMQEKILNRFDQQAPNTYDRGSRPIDGIFCSAGLVVKSGGYTDFEWEIGSTHRMVWIDFTENSFYQGKPPTLWQPIARRLKTEDPRVVQRYVDTKIEELAKNSTIPKLTLLYNEYS